MKHQACGLNGLWGIRNPYIWFSTWYWDVNIQAAFAGVFSSNRLDLGKVFSDGLRCYTDSASWFAEEHHRMSGISADYPYLFYYSTWPWCAMYLWFQYEYSKDVEYLRNDAYPIFLKICEFLLQVYKYDEEKGYYSVYPDISPEQGPLTHDTAITTATVKITIPCWQSARRLWRICVPTPFVRTPPMASDSRILRMHLQIFGFVIQV